MTSGGNHWSSLTLGAGGRLDLNRRARPQPLGRASTSNYGQGKEMGTVDGMVHVIFCASKGPGLGSWETKVLVLILPLSSCVALGDTFSEPQFSEL